MSKKIVKVFGRCLNVLLWAIMLFAVSAIVFVVLGKVLTDFDPVGYIYTFAGEIIMSIQFLINGQAEFTQNYVSYVICVSLAVIIVCFFAIKDVSNVYKNKYNKNKKFSLVSSLILCSIFFIFFAFNLIVLCIHYNKFLTFLTANAPGFVIQLTGGADIIMIKSIIVCALLIVVSAVVFFVFLLTREKEQKQQIKQSFNFNFYSGEYEQKEANENKSEALEPSVEEAVSAEQKPKQKKQAQDLVTKIMQLNELKDTGQITEVEYTRLRQKAIKRYKV